MAVVAVYDLQTLFRTHQIQCGRKDLASRQNFSTVSNLLVRHLEQFLLMFTRCAVSRRAARLPLAAGMDQWHCLSSLATNQLDANDGAVSIFQDKLCVGAHRPEHEPRDVCGVKPGNSCAGHHQ